MMLGSNFKYIYVTILKYIAGINYTALLYYIAYLYFFFIILYTLVFSFFFNLYCVVNVVAMYILYVQGIYMLYYPFYEFLLFIPFAVCCVMLHLMSAHMNPYIYYIIVLCFNIVWVIFIRHYFADIILHGFVLSIPLYGIFEVLFIISFFLCITMLPLSSVIIRYVTVNRYNIGLLRALHIFLLAMGTCIGLSYWYIVYITIVYNVHNDCFDTCTTIYLSKISILLGAERFFNLVSYSYILYIIRYVMFIYKIHSIYSDWQLSFVIDNVINDIANVSSLNICRKFIDASIFLSTMFLLFVLRYILFIFLLGVSPNFIYLLVYIMLFVVDYISVRYVYFAYIVVFTVYVFIIYLLFVFYTACILPVIFNYSACIFLFVSIGCRRTYAAGCTKKCYGCVDMYNYLSVLQERNPSLFLEIRGIKRDMGIKLRDKVPRFYISLIFSLLRADMGFGSISSQSILDMLSGKIKPEFYVNIRSFKQYDSNILCSAYSKFYNAFVEAHDKLVCISSQIKEELSYISGDGVCDCCIDIIFTLIYTTPYEKLSYDGLLTRKTFDALIFRLFLSRLHFGTVSKFDKVENDLGIKLVNGRIKYINLLSMLGHSLSLRYGVGTNRFYIFNDIYSYNIYTYNELRFSNSDYDEVLLFITRYFTLLSVNLKSECFLEVLKDVKICIDNLIITRDINTQLLELKLLGIIEPLLIYFEYKPSVYAMGDWVKWKVLFMHLTLNYLFDSNINCCDDDNINLNNSLYCVVSRFKFKIFLNILIGAT